MVIEWKSNLDFENDCIRLVALSAAIVVLSELGLAPYPLHTIKFIPDSDMLFPYSKNVLRKFHSAKLFNGNFCELGRAGSLRKRWNFHLRLSAKRILFYFRPNSDRFRTRSVAVRRPCTMNVRIEPVQEMFKRHIRIGN